MQLKLQPIYAEYCRNHYEPLDRSCVDSYLQDYISDEALRQYNEALPAKDEIDKYIKELGAYQRVRKGGVAFKLQISNDGTAKAKDIRAFIDFPEEFLLYDSSDIEDIEEPEAPVLPESPIEKAEEEYVKQMNPVSATASAKGKFKAEISIMCSEYLEPIESYIDIKVV